MDLAGTALALLIVAGGVLVFGGIGYTLYRLTRTGTMYMGNDGERQIPIVAAFAGVRGMPWWYAIATNNAAPLLVIYPDAVLCRVLRKRRRPMSAIERVDVNTGPGTVNLQLQFRGETLVFAANVRTKDVARSALALLPKAAMTPRACAMMDVAQ